MLTDEAAVDGNESRRVYKIKTKTINNINDNENEYHAVAVIL